MPSKAVLLAFIFFMVGIALFSIGFCKDVQAFDPFNGLLFWGTGVVLATPGIYFTNKIL